MGNELTGEERFEKCRFRSLETYPESYALPCCGARIQEGYACFVFPDLGNNIKPEICGFCRKFKPRLTQENAS